jgi:hypothetical protein
LITKTTFCLDKPSKYKPLAITYTPFKEGMVYLCIWKFGKGVFLELLKWPMITLVLIADLITVFVISGLLMSMIDSGLLGLGKWQ